MNVLTLPPLPPFLSRAVLATALLLCSSCTAHLLSGVPAIDHSRPVVWIETRSGAEMGAATSEGILFLGRSATTGPCRVHYFLGHTPVVEDGEVRPFGSVFHRAEIDLRHPVAHLLGRDPAWDDPLYVLLHTGNSMERIPVTLAFDDRVEGDVLTWPGRPLPPGAPVCIPDGDRWLLVGLVAGQATLSDGTKFIVFAGCDRQREALAVPRPYPEVRTLRHRPDDIHFVK